MPLEEDDLRHLTAAEGFMELGMPLEANEELEQIEPEVRHVPEVLAVRLAVYQETKSWELMRTVAGRLWRYDPKEPRWWHALAYATRRAESISAARMIVIEAVTLHPDYAIFHLTLACYECQLGNVDVAKKCLQTAFTLDSNLRAQALEDADLEPLWQSL